ncbi:hypothetical protein RB628_03630 [Streptomyces sp. ADMS]|uniref:hypothetical protein n=1 Tax=Streptomyces sp. ADMS TaxID=3071415 RepID=UPI00296E539A|nr:hypothetical protein [Streptomyces sp. ADMS]MDW4904451.1 hypothetical protein [Streptomyces sp. ADMS]
MASRKTTMDPPVQLGLPRADPEPPPDCDVCAALGRQRSEAAKAGDMSRVSDCNVEIRSHPTHSTS